ncbi:MAG TPA: YcnI family protein [Alphaproteobacteria bacterium]|nr:YcnI family protein [Alphaproteobacteria bacterium]
MKSVLVASALLVAAAGSVHAHVTANPNEAPADAYFRTALRIGHGCSGAATTAVRVKIPDGVLAVRPQAKPGWAIEIKLRKLDTPASLGHGRTVSETVDEIAWRGGPLPDAHFDEFGLTMRMPAKAGATLYFPVVQECEQGVHRWIEIPAADQKWDDLKEPAPFVRLIDAPKR